MNYSIGQFSKLTQLSAPTLRYYEQEQLIVVNRDALGRRYYTAADVEWILFIKKLKDTGMPIKSIREYAILRYQGDATIARRLEILEKHKLAVMQEKEKWDENLQNLEGKIAIYQSKLNVKKR
ncbi:MAG: MerR family transcriptional regulator [Sporomusaceae bacterium]|nr:MerR family transcriptional regulator [Sporomusaceae bacterium]